MNYILKTVRADGTSYGGFQWPLKIGAKVVAPDWDETPECSGGLHGLLNGCGNGNLLDWSNDAVWVIAKVPKKAQIIDLNGKVKVDRCKVVHVGNQFSATSFLLENGCDGPVVGAHVVVGNDSTATAGFRGTATTGFRGTAVVGDYGTATTGFRGTAVVGDYGTATTGFRGTATAGTRGIIHIRWYDGQRYRTAVGYVGENGIEANVPYIVQNGRLVKK